MRRVIILGAAGRDFHNFLTYYKDKPEFQVVAFTATQIPGIENRKFPAELAGPRYPDGIPIYPEEQLPDLISRLKVDEVVFSYSDISHVELMHKASIALATGSSFTLLGTKDTMLASNKPVVAVCAVRTGAGKSPTVRKISRILRDMGYQIAIIRHPMPYGDLRSQAVQEFTSFDDLERFHTTIEEREEYEAQLANGFPVYAGVDYSKILKLAEEKADIVIFDGGNNDFSFVKPDLLFVVADARRPGHELTYHPGETNARMADYIIVNKVDAAPKENTEQILANLKALNPRAKIILANLRDSVENSEAIEGKRILCVEDGPTLTHGGLSTGAAYKVATQFRAGKIVDPRNYAVGSLKEAFQKFKHIGPVLPAMGYSEEQRKELEETINRAECDLVIVGTPVNLAKFLHIQWPTLRVTYEIEEVEGSTIREAIVEFASKHPIEISKLTRR